MDIERILVFLVVGAVAGWLAGFIVSGYGYGVLANIVIGIAGAFIAGARFRYFDFSIGSGMLSSILPATIGAVILLVLTRIVKAL